jgi:molecular chaperone IbpA
MLNYDFTPLSRSFIGFDRMAGLIDNAAKLNGTGSYPPYNIAQISEDEYLIELAVAGFGDDDLNIETHENVLTIVGTKAANGNLPDPDAEFPANTYLHRGIAERGFERRFQLADHVSVTGADLVNGMLRIDLRRELPEAMKPRTISIGSERAQKHNENLTTRKSCGKRKVA